MKIEYKVGNLLTCNERYIAHGCNDRGIMGKGVALAIRRKYPQVFQQYEKYHKEFTLSQGECIITCTGAGAGAGAGDGKVVLNLITQSLGNSYRNLNYESLYKCLITMNSIMGDNKPYEFQFVVDKVAMPKIGAGLAGGDWEIIQRMIQVTSTNYKPVVYTLA